MGLDFKQTYATSTAITATGLASLTTGSSYELAAVDNSSNRYDHADIYVAFKLATGTPGSDLTVYVYMYLSEDGTNYTDNATGSAGSITLRAPTNLPLLGVIRTPDSGGLTYKAVFNTRAVVGQLPRKWGLVFLNRSNVTSDSTGGNFTVTYTGKYQSAVAS
jgi:hypothetical protein